MATFTGGVEADFLPSGFTDADLEGGLDETWATAGAGFPLMSFREAVIARLEFAARSPAFRKLPSESSTTTRATSTLFCAVRSRSTRRSPDGNGDALNFSETNAPTQST